MTPPVLEELALEPAEYANGRICQPITGFRTGMIGGKEVETSYGKTISYGIRRCEFDHFLLERCGVRTRRGEAVKTIEREHGRTSSGMGLALGLAAVVVPLAMYAYHRQT